MKIKLKLMKTTKLIRYALYVAVFAACIVGCEKVDTYSIDAPDDLEDIIDSIANIEEPEDATDLDVLEARCSDDLYQVGVTANTTAFWGDFSKYYVLEDNSDTVFVKFKNFTSENAVWDNWITVITSDDNRDGDAGNYVEYCVWRADSYSNYCWGTENGTSWGSSDGDSQADREESSYSDIADDSDDFDTYAGYMNGADCAALVTRGGDTVYVDITMESLSGYEMTKSFYIVEKGIEDQPVRAYWTIEAAHLVFYKTLNTASDEYVPDNDVDENWDSDTLEGDDDDETTSTTYRADMTATVTDTEGNAYTYTFYAEGMEYPGYGSFLLSQYSYLEIDPEGTYYCALADTATSDAWFYPYSETTTIDEPNNVFWGSDTEFSEYTSVIGEGYFHYKFVNYTYGTDNWDNWLLVLTNGYSRSSANYAECFVLRSDVYGWGSYYVGDNISSDFDFTDFPSLMNGATVEISLKITAEDSSSTSSVGETKVLEPGETIQ